ncbi:MAG: 3-isopropylmalate dehydratase small subunit [Hyphomicrobiales bacterium]
MTQTDPIPLYCDIEQKIVDGVVVAFPAINIDTDAIFPKQFLKTIKRTGLRDALFADWRRGDDNTPNPNFVLNRPDFQSSKILIGGDNFGCGSSREHAVWALRDFGIRALISTSYGSIFQNNCIKNGIWPLTVNPHDLERLIKRSVCEQPRKLTLDLAKLLIFPGDGTSIIASVSASDHANLLSGLDEIDLTLQKFDDIKAFEEQQSTRFPWVATQSIDNARCI